MHLIGLLSLLILCASCGRPALVLQQQQIGPTYLASTNVGTPDPRTPPKGQMIIAEYWVPRRIVNEHPILRISVLFHNYCQDCVEFPIRSTVGYETYSVLNREFKETCGLLAYKAEIVTCDGEVLTDWKHQLWTELITIDTDEMSSAAVE
ncbi:MAG: hypothetical protein JSS30_04595 [Verrucomicrobia bacterium]|nr:hypothetical protein [Verrucomicrobiota bacterium]